MIRFVYRDRRLPAPITGRMEDTEVATEGRDQDQEPFLKRTPGGTPFVVSLRIRQALDFCRFVTEGDRVVSAVARARCSRHFTHQQDQD
jgi:hypothetical protein